MLVGGHHFRMAPNICRVHLFNVVLHACVCNNVQTRLCAINFTLLCFTKFHAR